jgi:hypothetical protein
MAVAFDAATSSGLQTVDFTFQHTPVGTPRGALVGVAQHASAEQVDDTAYGAATPTAVTGSPSEFALGEGGTVHLDFLGASVPTGEQTVAVNETGGSNKAGFALTVTADADVVVQDTTVLAGEDGTGDITGTLSLGGNVCFCGVLVWNGANAVGGFAPLTGWTDRGEVDLGTECCSLYTYNTVDSADVTFGIAAGANTFDYNMLGFALTEEAGGAAVTSESRLHSVETGSVAGVAGLHPIEQGWAS